jgi:hypothetical protein
VQTQQTIIAFISYRRLAIYNTAAYSTLWQTWRKHLQRCITTKVFKKSRGISRSKSSRTSPARADSFLSYWSQRHRIFSKYDEGVWLTDDAWFGVTPEPVAKLVTLLVLARKDSANFFDSKIATQMAQAAPEGRSILIDAFAGAGGNSIAFALTGKWKRVYAIEKNPAVLQCAKHNAKIYGVDKKITWFEGDCFDILKNQLKDLAPYSVIFASPPWGGKPDSVLAMII